MAIVPARRFSSVGRAMAVVAAIFMGFLHTTSGQQVDPRRDPASALTDAVRLLERKDYAAFIRTSISPGDLDGAVKKFGSFDNVVLELSRSGRFPMILMAFQAALKTAPTFNPEGTRANYAFDVPIDGERRLQLRKVGDLWYWAD